MIVNNRRIGDGEPCWIVAEIGINHNGSVDIAKQLIEVAAVAGCDAVKFQKRCPEVQVPESDRGVLRQTPWGLMTTLDYRKKIELDANAYDELALYADWQGIHFFFSVWDVESIRFTERYCSDVVKIPSAKLRDEAIAASILPGQNVILSTGMARIEDIITACSWRNRHRLALLQCSSVYPCPDEEVDLSVIGDLRKIFDCPIGYSGHEVGILPSILAVAKYNACIVERHVTLDRGMPGSDHGASLEPIGLLRLARDIRRVERLLQVDSAKRITPSEYASATRLGVAL